MTTTTKKTSAKKASASKTAEASFENFWGQGSQKVQEQFAKASASFEDVATFQRENAEAFAETATLAQKSLETLAAETVTFSQKSYDDSVAVAKKALASNNIQDAFELQSEFARSSMEACMGQMKKFGELFQASAREVSAPMNTRMTAVMETAQKAAL